jgi:hypothetical protein
MKLLLLLTVHCLLFTACHADDYLVGVYYFAGWWRDTPNKYFTAGHDWREDYPGRIPVLGQYNEQKTMDREIIAASSNGVDFFQILWYPNGGSLNEGVRTFMASPNAGRMKFTIEYVNHPPFDLPTDEAWEAACREWCAAMKHPSYLRVGGRPVFKVHGAEFFLQQNGNDPKRVAARLDTLRRIAKEAGLPNPLISGGVGAGGVAGEKVAGPYDFLATYMEMPNLPQRDEPYPYEDLIKYAEDGWARYGKAGKPYVPYVPSGWDPRPWKDPRPSFMMPTRDQWNDALMRVKSALDKYPTLGIPVKGGPATGSRERRDRQKAILIYAWNEFGEGGIVAPTKGEGTMKLDVIREVF